jgi:Na+:H+ antiporter, NhaA family
MSRNSRRQSQPVARLLSPLRDFLATEASGALLLAGGAVLALIWVNSPWSHSYEELWTTQAGFDIAGHGLTLDLRGWVNDALMTIFFFVVGLEIKRELTDGHLATKRTAILPGIAALGGMMVPALIYLAIAGGTAARGWAIPMATDIALAVGVLTVAGSRVPGSLRAFLLGLAIVDDIGAIVVIALFYTTSVVAGWLATAVLGLALAMVFKWLGVHATGVYVLCGALVWLGFHEAGIHPTISGVIMGLLAPTTARLNVDLIDVEELADLSDIEAARSTSQLARGSVSVVEWLQHVLHPWTSYLIVPVFALANSGIEVSFDRLRDAVDSPITWGVFLGLLVGKPIGVQLATRGAVRAHLSDMPTGTSSRHLMGASTAAGIGFTVSLFITELAFDDPVDQSNAKLAILVASVTAAVLSSSIFLSRGRTSPSPEAVPSAAV